MRSIIRSILHVGIIISSFYLAYLTRSYTDLIPFTQLRIPPLHFQETMLYGCVCALLFLLIGVTYNLYPIKKISYNYMKLFFDCSIIWLVCITFLAYFGAGFIFFHGISRLVIVFWFGISCIGMYLIDIVFDLLIPARIQTVLIINNADQEQITHTLQDFERIQEYIVSYHDNLDIKELLRIYTPDTVLVVGDIPYDSLQYIADRVTIAWSDMMHISQGMLLDDLDFQITRLGPVLGMHYRAHSITERDAVVKRVCDIVWSSILLVILSPLMLLTALFILLFDSWPILYRHQRVGKNRVPFDYIKFRSMKKEYCTWEYFGTKEAESYWKELQDSPLNVRKGELQKIINDPRITKIGAIIRKYSIDELPSLRCILKGDMSLVWPRPHLESEVIKYQPWMKRLLSVKPGMTCYSQLYGRDRLPFADEARFDLYYIQHRSLLFDFSILLSTMKVVFQWR